MLPISFVILSTISIMFSFFLLINRRLSILGFFCFLIIIPSSNIFNPFLSKNGFYFYDFYFLILSFHFMVFVIREKKITKAILISCISLFIFLSFYTYIFLFQNIIIDKYLLRDLRPFLILFYSIIILNFLNNNFIQPNKYLLDINGFLRILIFAFLIKILFSFVTMFYPSLFTSDIYYIEQNYRYIDSISFIAALFLVSISSSDINKIAINRILYFISICLALIVLIISNSRTLLAITFCLLILGSNLKIYKKLLLIIPLTIIPYFYVEYFGISRILSMDILGSLTARFAPAVSKIMEMSIIERLFGYGLRTYFEIPWFEYRGLDPYLNSIDSMYLTFFVKYGFCSLLLIILFLYLVTKNIVGKKDKLMIIIFFILLFIVYCPLYQNYAITYIFYLILWSSTILQAKELNKI